MRSLMSRRLPDTIPYKEYDGKMFEMVLKAAMELAEGLLWPNFQEMDKNPPELVDDQIKVHSSVKKVLREMW